MSMILVSGFLLIACAGVAALEHKISYSRKGTRSEAQHGYLYFDKTALPDVFEYVRQDDQAWSFHARRNIWGLDGYHTAEVISIPDLGQGIGQADLERGWYRAPGRLGGTPTDWLHVKWGTNSAFVAPASIQALVTALKPPRLARDRRLEELTGN